MNELLHQTGETTAEQVSSAEVLIPAVDIFENEKELVIKADLPGVTQEDLHIKLEKDVLTIEGMTKTQAKEDTCLLAEFGDGRYFRQFTLGQSIDRAAIVAKLKNGELELTLPKAAAAQPQRITVTGA